MDLQIKGRKAIVCAASQGLGLGCARALAAEGVDLVICARTEAKIQAAAREISGTYGVAVTPVACDITTQAGRDLVLGACSDPDILITNAGGPPAGDFRDFSEEDWRKAVEGNMITPISLIRATVYGMMARGFGRIVNITSISVKQPIGTLELSNGARTGLTGAISALSRKVAGHNVVINNLLPGPFDTARLHKTSQAIAAQSGVPVEKVHAERAQSSPTGRFGRPDEFGAVCAFLCSAHVGYMTGQNILLDGGACNSTF